MSNGNTSRTEAELAAIDEHDGCDHDLCYVEGAVSCPQAESRDDEPDTYDGFDGEEAFDGPVVKW